MARYTKAESVSILYAAARSYQEKLSKRMFRLIYKSNLHQRMEAVDVVFQPENFKHLTGIQTDIRPWRFYDACLKRRNTKAREPRTASSCILPCDVVR